MQTRARGNPCIKLICLSLTLAGNDSWGHDRLSGLYLRVIRSIKPAASGTLRMCDNKIYYGPTRRIIQLCI